MEKQKYVIFVKGSETFNKAMFHVYINSEEVRPNLKYVYKLNENDLKDFLIDKDLEDIEVVERVDMNKVPTYLLGRKARLVMNAERMYSSLSEVRRFLLENFTNMAKIPFFNRITQVMKNVDREKQDE